VLRSTVLTYAPWNPELARLELPLFDLAANSIPLIVTTAFSNRLNPSISPVRCFTRRESGPEIALHWSSPPLRAARSPNLAILDDIAIQGQVS
jgi:hypothetical protein